MYLYHTCVNFRGLILHVFCLQKVCGVLVFMAMVAWYVRGIVRFAKYANYCGLIFVK